MSDPRHIEYASLLLALLIGCMALLLSARAATALRDMLAEPSHITGLVKAMALQLDQAARDAGCGG